MAGISPRPSWAEVHKSHQLEWEAGTKSLLSLTGNPPVCQQSKTFPFPRFGHVLLASQSCRGLRESWKINHAQKTPPPCPSVLPPSLLMLWVCTTRAQSQHRALHHPAELLQIYPSVKESKSLACSFQVFMQIASVMRSKEEKYIRCERNPNVFFLQPFFQFLSGVGFPAPPVC